MAALVIDCEQSLIVFRSRWVRAASGERRAANAFSAKRTMSENSTDLKRKEGLLAVYRWSRRACETFFNFHCPTPLLSFLLTIAHPPVIISFLSALKSKYGCYNFHQEKTAHSPIKIFLVLQTTPVGHI